jgi:hypothetical protein
LKSKLLLRPGKTPDREDDDEHSHQDAVPSGQIERRKPQNPRRDNEPKAYNQQGPVVPFHALIIPKAPLIEAGPLLLSPERANSLEMAIAAQELVQAILVGLEGQFRYRSATLGALPITLVHLPLETLTTAIIIEIHCTENLTTFFGLRIQQNGLKTL